MKKLSRLPDLLAIAVAYYIAYGFITTGAAESGDRAFAAIMSFLAVLLGWKILKNRGWFLKLIGYPVLVLIFLLLQGAVADFLTLHFN